MKQDYKEWFMEQWNNNGGLISQKDAALILKKSPTRIRQMINEGKFKTIQYDKSRVPFLSLQQVLLYYQSKKILEEADDYIGDKVNKAVRKIMDYPEDVYPDDPPEEMKEKIQSHRGKKKKLE